MSYTKVYGKLISTHKDRLIVELLPGEFQAVENCGIFIIGQDGLVDRATISSHTSQPLDHVFALSDICELSDITPLLSPQFGCHWHIGRLRLTKQRPRIKGTVLASGWPSIGSQGI